MAKFWWKNGITSVILRLFIMDSASTTGAGKTGLAYNTSGLIISTIANNEATATAYTAGGSNIETITTLGTFAAPTSGKCRFKEVDSTNHPGLYEIQIADARWAVSNARSLIVTVLGASGAAPVHAEVQLVAVDPLDAVRFGQTALPNANAAAVGGLLTAPTTANVGLADLSRILGTALSETVGGYLAAGFKKLHDVAAPVFTLASVNQTGDSYARIGVNGAGLTVLALASDVATILSALTTIAGYIDTEVAAILAAVDTEVAAIKAKTDNLPSDPADQSQVEAAITAATSGLATAAKLLKYVQLLARKDAAIATDNATELTAINASGGSGAGAYANTTDSQEALRDRGDAAWTTGSSVLGSGSEAIRIRCLNGADPVDGAAVWITTDSAGTNVVAGTVYTDATGYTPLILLDGAASPGVTYYVWRQASGVNFDNPDEIQVLDV